MAVILFGLKNGRTVNLSRLAIHFPGTALHASNHRPPTIADFSAFSNTSGWMEKWLPS